MKTNKIIFWGATIFIALFEGAMPLSTLLFARQYFNAGTKPLGYPDYFAVALIICKIAGSLALVIPTLPSKVREWAYAGFTFNLLFATLSHVIVDGFLIVSFFPLLIWAILGVSYFYNARIYAPQA